MQQRFDVAIVGGGIVGLAHAWMAAARGLRVVLFERSPRAQGASIRNFGMVWPIGQPMGQAYATAYRSRLLWLALAEQAGVWVDACGSLHVAHRADELAVLEEYVALTRHSQTETRLWSADEVLRRTPAALPRGLLGGMWSPSELAVNPPQAIAQLPGWLARQHRVQCEFSTAITQLGDSRLVAADGRQWHAERIVICSGIDFQTLLPEVFQGSELRLCKLHMLRTVAQTANWRIGTHLASGLTLRHYAAFAACPSLAALQQRVREETPELDQYGIHVMASQNELGQVVLGDSHEYDEAISPFDRAEIDELILRELKKQFVLPDWTIEQRWHGIYAKHPRLPVFTCEPTAGTHVFVGPGGAGMTMSFGLADHFWEQLTGQELVL